MSARGRSGSPSLEYSLLLTATLCLLAFGVVMVFSASSTTSLLGDAGDGAYYLKRTVLFGAIGLLVMRILSVRGVRILRPLTGVVLAVSFALCAAVLVPGVGMEVNGSRAWIGAGAVQIQPSELMKLALILYGAHLLATRAKMVKGGIGPLMPFLGLAGFGLFLVVIGDLGTALVMSLAIGALLVASGVRMRDLGLLAGGVGGLAMLAIMIEPYRMSRITTFLDPGGDPGGAGFQLIQAKIALGSGGLFGTGLGESLQKAFYLPEAHTDMIAAVIGEELGLMGIVALVGLYGMFGYAGLRIAQNARDRYSKLLAAGLTSLVMIQALVNLLAVFGMAPLTGVPLPFVSYGNASMLVMLAAVGLLLNIANPRGARLRVVHGAQTKSRHSRGGHRGARGASARGRRRASG